MLPGNCFPATSITSSTQWQTATVRSVDRPSDRLVMLQLQLSHRQPQLAGQHFVVRLTADDGYTASRSYSVASRPDAEMVELCVERLADGEVSGYLYEGVEPGDQLEVRGPIGGWFVWDGSCRAVAIGGGTGVVPLVAMLRQATASGCLDRLRFAASARSAADLPYLYELKAAGATIALTGAGGARLDVDDLRPLIADAQLAFVCGSTSFAEAMSVALVDAGFSAGKIRVERFGPTG